MTDPELLAWATRVSQDLLEPLGARWRHTLGVVECAQGIARTLPRGEAEVLIAAAYLHDIGYAPELALTGFHPLDGARFVRAHEHERLAGLVAYHTSALAEATERGLQQELAQFIDERSTLSSALTYCDLNTDAEGRPTSPTERLQSVQERYGPEAPQRVAFERAMPEMLDDVRIIESIRDAVEDEKNQGPRSNAAAQGPT